jgi:hypothetical protein
MFPRKRFVKKFTRRFRGNASRWHVNGKSSGAGARHVQYDGERRR